MSDPRLPQAEFIELPAPPNGELVAVRAGRGIRRRRRMLGTGAAAFSMALIAGVAVAAGTGADHASDQLVPAGPGLHQSHVTPSPAATRAATVAAGHPAATDLTSTTDGATGSGTAPVTRTGTSQNPSSAAGARQQSSTGYRTPPLRRTYRSAPPPSAPSTQQGPSSRICNVSSDNSAHGGAITTDWCVSSIATRTSHGHDLAIEICRDSTGRGQLSFSSQVEVDLAVLSGNKTVWRWSTGQPDAADTHVLNVAADGCWTWTAPWTDVSASGRRLRPGSYTLEATSTAAELQGLAPETTTFSVA